MNSDDLKVLALAKKYTDENTPTPTDTQVKTAVDEYLTDNPVAIDDTLTQSGEAADALVAGTKIDELKKIIGDYTQEITIDNLTSWKADFVGEYSNEYCFKILTINSNTTPTKIVIYGIKSDNTATLLKNNAVIGEEYKLLCDGYSAIRVYVTFDTKNSGSVKVSIISDSDISTVQGKVKKLESDVVSLNEEINRDISLKDKKISILGVSIDTYGGYIPSENVAYYTDGKAQLPNGVNDTWWKKIIDKTGATLLKNNSYTGACATTNGKDYDSSGVCRCLSLSDTAENPDIILIGMFGANDWVYSDCGSWDMSMSDLLASKDVDLSIESNYNIYKSIIETYAGAMATIFYRLQEKYPNARIFALDMYNYRRSNEKNPPRRSASNKTVTVAHYNKALKDVADYFNVIIVPTSTCGINSVNSALYTVEGEDATSNLHPNSLGHNLIYKVVLNALKNAL